MGAVTRGAAGRLREHPLNLIQLVLAKGMSWILRMCAPEVLEPSASLVKIHSPTDAVKEFKQDEHGHPITSNPHCPST